MTGMTLRGKRGPSNCRSSLRSAFVPFNPTRIPSNHPIRRGLARTKGTSVQTTRNVRAPHRGRYFASQQTPSNPQQSPSVASDKSEFQSGEEGEDSKPTVVSNSDTLENKNPDAALTARVRAELAESGVNFDDLLDSGRTVKLARELDTLEVTLESTSDADERKELLQKSEKIKREFETVSRQVMQPALKRLFLGQAIMSTVVAGIVASDSIPGTSVPLVGRALAFWTVWLFTIPSLRARKGIPSWEKSALNIAFLTTPLANIALPTITKNTTGIWAASVGVLLACYTYYYVRRAPSSSTDDGEGGQGKKKEQSRIRGILRYLDWGSWR